MTGVRLPQAVTKGRLLAVDRGYAMVRPLLFQQANGDAEVAHHRAVEWLAAASRRPAALRGLRGLLNTTGTPRTVFGVTFPNPVGIAAGMDKNGVALPAWAALGFGFTEVGTVTARPQLGNPTPRVFRLRDSAAIVNRMGFNNDGAQALADRLSRLGPLPTPLGISLGKSKATPVADAVEDYLVSLRLLAGYASYLAVNVSSPNTPGLRSLQDRAPLTELLAALIAQTRTLAGSGTPVPVLLKIAPDLSDQAIGEVLQVCQDTGVAGLIATNTTVSRDGVAARDAALAAEAGGLSGAPLTVRAREVVRFVTARTDLPVIGVGGIMTTADGLAMLDAGAALIQLYTGFVYSGPALVGDLVAATASSGCQAGSPVTPQPGRGTR